MKLTHIEIRGYRSLFQGDDGHFEMSLGDGVNAITGPNNVGKSNIFRALSLALDPDFEFDRQRDMPANWTWSKPTVTLTFQVQERAIPSRESTLLKLAGEYERAVRPDGKRYFADEREIKLRATIEGGEDSAGVLRRAFVTKGAGARDLRDDDKRTIKALKQFDECVRFVLVRSGESLESLLQGRFRDVLQAILKAELRSEYEAALTNRDLYVSSLQDGLLSSLRARLSRETQELFPEVSSVELDPHVRGLEETLTGIRVRVSDAAVTDLADKGTGVRGALIVAMLQHLAATSKRSMVFAVEEPESFLHPAAQENLRGDLEELAQRRDVSLLVTTHSPYVMSRKPEARVFSIVKTKTGRTFVHGATNGDEPMNDALGGLFRSSLMAGFLDRAARSVDGERALLVVEGETDRTWITLATERSGRKDLLEGLTVVTAGDGLPGGVGGATMAASQALLLRSTSPHPVGILLDNDDEGKECLALMSRVHSKTGDWKVGKRVFCYRMALDPSDHQFEYEAEDLWPGELHEAFLAEAGEDGVLSEKKARPKTVGGYHYGYQAQAKPALAEYLEGSAEAHHCDRWVKLLQQIRSGLGV